jgi:hypothetical protein
MLGTPLILFLILLSALVISMLFGNSWLLSRKEGFVSFGYSNPNIMQVTISQYSASNTVIYLYDNLYFDGKNGNIIEVDSAYCGNVRVNGSTIDGNVSCNDSTGSTITQLWVTTSNANTTNFPVVSNSNNSALTNLTSLMLTPQISQLTYLSNSQNLSPSNSSGYRYQLFNISWGSDSFLHLLSLDPTTQSGQNLKSFYYDNTGSMMRYIDFNSTNYIPNYNSTYSSNTEPNNSTLIIDNKYDTTNQIYQITPYVKYDIQNGYVLIGKELHTIYNRSTGSTITAASKKPGVIENLSFFVSWTAHDGNNGEVVVMSFGLQTLILVLNADPNQKYYNLSYCARFNELHYISSLADMTNIEKKEDISKNETSESPCTDELSCKWYYYFKTIGKDTSVLFKNDYIRKTQIVPPVCPRCPNCPSSGVCNGCGGNGGCGTTDASGNSVTGTVKGVVKGTVDLTKETVGGAVNLTKEVVGGTVNLAKDTIGGAVDLTKETVGGAVGLLKGSNKRDDKKNDNSYLPVDNYSYYGASQTNSSNYMPVTADFSAFSK